MAKKKDKGNPPRPPQPEPDDIIEIVEEPEELVEIIEEPAEVVEIVEEPEIVEFVDEPPAPVKAESPDVNLGGPLAKLPDGSDILEVDEAELEFVEPPPQKKPVPPPPGAR